jgi:hypothetical protein
MPLLKFPRVKRCLLATIPSGCPGIAEAREAVERTRCGFDCFDPDANLVVPEIVHQENTNIDSSYTFVFDFGLPHTVSPYLCPYPEVFCNYESAKKYLSMRADIWTFLRRLSGRVLVCGCSFGRGTCWAGVLVDHFRGVFPSSTYRNVSDDSDDLVPAVSGCTYSEPAWYVCEGHNRDVVSSGLQPTRRRFPQLVEDGLDPDAHIEAALQLEHPCREVCASTLAVEKAVSWS